MLSFCHFSLLVIWFFGLLIVSFDFLTFLINFSHEPIQHKILIVLFPQYNFFIFDAIYNKISNWNPDGAKCLFSYLQLIFSMLDDVLLLIYRTSLPMSKIIYSYDDIFYIFFLSSPAIIYTTYTQIMSNIFCHSWNICSEYLMMSVELFSEPYFRFIHSSTVIMRIVDTFIQATFIP